MAQTSKPAPAALWAILFVLTAVLCAGCGNQQSNSANTPPHLHEAVPPHGGTPVPLSDDYQIEWVLDASAGRLQAYFLDGEMENFVRITPASFDVTATISNRREVLHLAAVANTATGEKIGSTSLFEAQGQWLKKINRFDVVIPQITVAGTTFSNIAFTFPKAIAPNGGK